jgi:prepilin-type processing-associated H-X9-DG protein
MNVIKGYTGREVAAFSLLELMAIVAALLIVAAVFLPALAKPKCGGSQRINCVNNLRQVGFSFRLWAGDNNGKYPAQVLVTNGGTLELTSAGAVSPNFVVMSNELGSAKIVACRADASVLFAANFAELTDTNVSYFVALSASEENPATWLAGDRNLMVGQKPLHGLAGVKTNHSISWSEAIHKDGGNVAFADGSVQQLSSRKLAESLRSQTNSPLRLVIPQ